MCFILEAGCDQSTCRPRRLWVRRRGGGLAAAAVSGDGDSGTAAAASTGLNGRQGVVVDSVDGWTGIVAAAFEQRTANLSALHISTHIDRSCSP